LVVGDAYRYTLTPVFTSLNNSAFRCRLRRRPDDVIYHVTVYVTLPGRGGLQSPTVQQQVRGHGDLVSGSRRLVMGMLTIEQSVVNEGRWLDEHSELTLSASRLHHHWTYTLQPATSGGPTTTLHDKHVVQSPGDAS